MATKTHPAIEKLLISAFYVTDNNLSVERFATHRNIYYTKNKQMMLGIKQPKAATKVSFDEIISLVQSRLPTLGMINAKKLSNIIRHMKNQKIQRIQRSSYITTIFCSIIERLIHGFQGRGFLTTIERADKLIAQLDQNGQALQQEYSEDAKAYRRWVYKQTISACYQGYILNGREVHINNTLVQTRSYLYTHSTALPEAQTSGLATYEVMETDTLSALIALKQENNVPVGMNFANAYTPGGGVQSGAGAQEEAICRCSNHIFGLNPAWYPLPEYGGIYTPHVFVIRESEQNGFAFRKPVEVALVAVAAYDMRETSCDFAKFAPDIADMESSLLNNQEFMEGMKNKLRNMFRTMALNGHKDIVLGAWGSGAFNIPPKVVANCFHAVLKEGEFAHCFRRVVFAIHVRNEKDRKNLEVYTNLCSDLNMEI
jgi:uncharacterized protein (TIGR02452 family)